MGAQNVPPISVRDDSQWSGPVAPLKDVTLSSSFVLIAEQRRLFHSFHSTSCFVRVCLSLSLSVCVNQQLSTLPCWIIRRRFPPSLTIFSKGEAGTCQMNGETFFLWMAKIAAVVFYLRWSYFGVAAELRS